MNALERRNTISLVNCIEVCPPAHRDRALFWVTLGGILCGLFVGVI